jgi:hypothetical protein
MPNLNPLQQLQTFAQILAASGDGGGNTITDAIWEGTPVDVPYGGGGGTTAQENFDAWSPFSAVGDILYGGAAGTGTRLPGNTTTTQKLLSQTGNGAASAAPAWSTLTAILDELLGTEQGTIAMRGASAWEPLVPGTSGYNLTSAGASADLVWAPGGGSPGGVEGDAQLNVSGAFGPGAKPLNVNTTTGAISAVGGDFTVDASGNLSAAGTVTAGGGVGAVYCNLISNGGARLFLDYGDTVLLTGIDRFTVTAPIGSDTGTLHIGGGYAAGLGAIDNSGRGAGAPTWSLDASGNLSTAGTITPGTVSSLPSATGSGNIIQQSGYLWYDEPATTTWVKYGNPFNQSLDTGDSPTFAGLTTSTSGITAQGAIQSISGQYYVGSTPGFTGTGAYTNFTIIGGIVTDAS